MPIALPFVKIETEDVHVFRLASRVDAIQSAFQTCCQNADNERA